MSCWNAAVRPVCFVPFFLLLCLLMAAPCFAEEAAAPAPTPEPAVVPDTLETKVAELASLALDELRAKAQAIEENIPKLAAAAQELAGQVRELRIAAQQSEAVLAVREEMAALQRKLEQVIDELPDVKAKAEEAVKAKAKLFQEMQLRTRVLAVIAAAERKAAEEGRAVEEAIEERKTEAMEGPE
ncbi:MAG: hypothetical protein KKC51_03090 [Verrucomicrobia bacterium]|nr:hypothetical protein [Verrucomicrobiota bacterium]